MQPTHPVSAPMVVSTIQSPQRKEHLMSNCVLGLSVTQIIFGFLCIGLQLYLIIIKTLIHFVGQGIWTGLFFILTGAFGISTSIRKTTYFIRIFLVLAIISAVITTGIFRASSQEIINMYYCNHMLDHNDYSPICASRNLVIGINAQLTIVSVLQAVVAIISSAFSCHGLCCGNQNQSMVMAGQVQYTQGPDGQQQMVIVPFNQQGAGLAAGANFNPAQAELLAYDQTPPSMYQSETKLPIPE